MRTGPDRAARYPRGERHKWLLITLVVVLVVVKLRFAWIPVWYLALAVCAPLVGWRAFRSRPARRGRRWLAIGVASVVSAALVPVPWMVAAGGQSPGNAWRLDGRVSIDGRTIDPDGDWLWLTAGRPPTLGELAWSEIAERFGDDTPAAATMVAGARRKRAVWSEPAAAAVGLARGGWEIDTRLEAHVSGPADDTLPSSAVVVAINDDPFDNAADWLATLDALGDESTFTTAAGDVFAFAGAFPYEHVDTVIVPSREVDVMVGGWYARTPIGRWWRNLATGSSHGLMVALVAYTFASGDEIGRGLTVAGTGSMRPDGSVGRIGGLVAKARAARRASADVLLFPADQASELSGFRSGEMELVGVATIDAAIAALRARQVS